MNETLPPHKDQSTRRKLWLRRGVELLLFIALIAGIRLWQQRDMPVVTPALSGMQLDQTPYALPAHPTRPMLVHFWATWCSVCRMEQSNIESIARDHADTITIAMQSGSTAEVARHLAADRLHFPVVNDADGRIAAAWGVHAVPASFILGPDGKIRFVEVGYTTETGLRLRLWLAGL